MVVSFSGLLMSATGIGSKPVHGMMQQAGGEGGRCAGWFRVDGGVILRSMSNLEFRLDIEGGPCLRVRIGEVDGGSAEFESIGDPLRGSPAGA